MKPIIYKITEGVNQVNQPCWKLEYNNKCILYFPKHIFTELQMLDEVEQFIVLQKEIEGDENIILLR